MKMVAECDSNITFENILGGIADGSEEFNFHQYFTKAESHIKQCGSWAAGSFENKRKIERIASIGAISPQEPALQIRALKKGSV